MATSPETGLRVLGSGVVSLLIGIGIAAAANTVTRGHVTLIVLAPIGLGVVGIVIGFMMILTGETDDARADS
jgi:Ca2+/Na+ antiporter